MEGTYLVHHGIKGQKWGVRRFQNDDGTLTEAGKKRYGVDDEGNMSEKGRRDYERHRESINRAERELEYEKSGGKGKKIAKHLFLGAQAHTYNSSRAAGEGRLKALGRSLIDFNPTVGIAISMQRAGEMASQEIMRSAGRKALDGMTDATKIGKRYIAAFAVRYGSAIAGQFTQDYLSKKAAEGGSSMSFQQEWLNKKYKDEYKKKEMR